MPLDENIYEIRLEKLKKIEALGQPAYPRKYNFSHTVPQILSEYGGQTAEELESPRVTVRVGRPVSSDKTPEELRQIVIDVGRGA